MRVPEGNGMFWANRLKEEVDTESSWVLSYGDLMTLLVAVFVMIAAMGDLGSGERFRRVSGGVRRAFGFGEVATAGSVVAKPARRSMTLVERLESDGFARRSRVQLIGPDDKVLAPCDVMLSGDRLSIRVGGLVSFASHSSSLKPAGREALRRITGYLADGTNPIEVKGHAGDGPAADDAACRDRLDLSYARARSVVDVLADAGIRRDRLHVTAWNEPPARPVATRDADDEASPDDGDGADRMIEIIVHTTPETMHD
jgi:chemotaxis protein MotB